MLTFETDVLVIGGGGAGLTAAIKARERGKKVLLVSKFGPGNATNTTLSYANYRIAVQGFSAQEHMQQSMTAGLGLNDLQLLGPLVEEGPQRIGELKQMGVLLEEKYGAGYCDGRLPFARGPAIVKPLTQHAARIGVLFAQPYLIWELLVSDGCVFGAWGLRQDNDKPALFLAPAVILACGGAGALYERHDNPQSISGDGYALAARAGLPLVDMEFVQFYPLCTAYGREGSREYFLPPLAAEAAPLVNSSGEDLIAKYHIDRPIALKARDLSCRALVQEKIGFLDYSLVAEHDWQKQRLFFDKGETLLLKKWLQSRLLKENQRIPILPAAHFCMGGIQVDAQGHTGFSGLYAAGETAGGLHGANRLGGNALTETVVYGMRAGEAAADEIYRDITAASCHWSAKAEKKVAQLWEEHSLGHQSPRQFNNALQKLMWDKAGVIRTGTDLSSALEELNKLGQIPLSTREAGLTKVLETKNRLITAEMICRAALFRQESRGSHFRQDFPLADDHQWKYHSQITLTDTKAYKIRKEIVK